MVKVYACCKCNVSVYNLMEHKKKCINNPSFYCLSKNLIEIQISFPGLAVSLGSVTTLQYHSISAWSQNCDAILINVYLRIATNYFIKAV